MAKVIKGTLYTVGGLIIALILACAALFIFVNPNDFKPQISQQVQAATGRQFAIKGKISWSFYPWLGLNIKGVTLGNAKGFGNKPFAQIGEADVSVRLLPLLEKHIELGKLTLDDLVLNLQQNANGQNNWQDMAKQQANANNPQVKKSLGAKQQGSFDLDALSVSGLEISNATIHFNNKGKMLTVSKFDLDSQDISLQDAFPLKFNFHINSKQPAVLGDIKFDSNIKLNLPAKTVALDNLSLETNLKHAPGMPKGINSSIETDAKVNYQNLSVVLKQLRASMLGVQLQANIKALDLKASPSISGNVQVNPFDLQDVANNAGIKLPASLRAKGFNNVSLSFNVANTKNYINLSQLRATLGQSNIKGSANIAKLNTLQSKFALNVDKINMNQLLVASQAAAATKVKPKAKPSNGELIPAATAAQIRKLKLLGNLRIGQLSWNKLLIDNFAVKFGANNGFVNVAPLSANFYGGTVNASVTANFASVPSFHVSEKIAGVKARPLFALIDLQGSSFMGKLAGFIKTLPITGKANLDLSVNTIGNNAASLKQSLNGSAAFKFTGGAVKGFNAQHLLQQGLAYLKKEQTPQQVGPNQTEFSDFSGSFLIKNGVATNSDLQLLAPFINVTGKGQIDLVKENINYKLNTVRVLTSKVNGKTIYKPQGMTIPLLVTGQLQHPKIKPDFNTLLKNKLASERKRIKKVAKKKVEKILGGKLEQLKKTFNLKKLF